MVRSSRLKICPLTMTDLPSAACPPRCISVCGSLALRPGSVDIGIPSLASTDGVGGADAGLGVKSSSLRRFHIGIALLRVQKSASAALRRGYATRPIYTTTAIPPWVAIGRFPGRFERAAYFTTTFATD